MDTIAFEASSITIEPVSMGRFLVSLEADERAVCADMSVENRVHEIEPSDIIEEVGAKNLLSAMAEKHFAQWVADNGDFYEALNAIGIERIREWIDDYCSQEDGR